MQGSHFMRWADNTEKFSRPIENVVAILGNEVVDLNILDKKGESLFNYTKKGKGLKHWLNDMSLKTHNEIAAKGSEFAKKNIWKLNLAHACGLAYSAITLGILLPMVNAKMTEYKSKKSA